MSDLQHAFNQAKQNHPLPYVEQEGITTRRFALVDACETNVCHPPDLRGMLVLQQVNICRYSEDDVLIDHEPRHHWGFTVPAEFAAKGGC